ncbi:hypothetical protein MMC28_004520 [Mycoblastus sanguinarius]|nr:hypothetical protein [Mycoblastus sanguinarius]
MHFLRLSTFFTGTLLIKVSIAGYMLTDDYSGDNFFGNFSAFTGTDPTSGFVQYADYATATQQKLIGSIQNSNGASSAFMGVDYTSQSPQGRASVRISSTKSFNKGLFILDASHMPGGICGVWPAFWLVGPNWPASGEIDILEGVNAATTNQMTLHTSAGCSIQSGGFSGSANTTNCDNNAPGQGKNAGCAIMDSDTTAFGKGFNDNGGGVYAMEWTDQAIAIWFFPRTKIPADIAAGGPNPSGWGQPVAQYQGGCQIDSHFQNMNIIFDTTFCGQWAGDVWAQSSCASKASTCNAYVQSNPGDFQEAYWLVNSVRVYQQGAAKLRKRGAFLSTGE